jgi:Ca2+-binding RTX toxin-like protein
MSSIVVDFNDGSTLTGENLEVIGKQTEKNLIDVKPDGAEGPSPVSIVGGSKDDIIRMTAAGDSTALGLDGHDSIIGGEGDDLIDGGEGDDELKGSRGNDILVGGVGNDLLDGGEDRDILKGGLGDDHMRGGIGNDLFEGGLGNDIMEGNDGDDIMKGGAGHDVIDGGEGRDIIKGGAGSDIMTGGAGNDIFAFVAEELASGVDHIEDFQVDEDKIRIVGLGDKMVSYDSNTGVIAVDGQEAINIGPGMEDLEMRQIQDTDNWEIM